MIALLLMICWPLAELYVAVQVATAIGVLYTVILLIAGWPLGAWLVRSEGRAAWRRLRAASATGRSPGREVLDGALILAGGSLFIVPGFISDLLGLLLLFAPTRSLARTVVARNLQGRLVRRATGLRGAGAAPGARSYDVDSTATEINPAHLPR